VHRLSVSSLVELVGEVPGRHVGPVAGFDGLGLGLGDVEGWAVLPVACKKMRKALAAS
jgi:hypothetical protein